MAAFSQFTTFPNVAAWGLPRAMMGCRTVMALVANARLECGEKLYTWTQTATTPVSRRMSLSP